MLLKPEENGILLENKICFGTQNCGADIFLSDKIGDEFVNKFENHINFPGEYEIKNIYITCYLGKKDKLNYFIHINNKKIGILQDTSIFEKFEEVPEVNTRLFTDPEIEKKLIEAEFSGEKILINLA